MRFSTSRWLTGALAIFVSAIVTANVNGQAAPTQTPKQVMVEDVYKNVQLLKGISATELWETMGFIAASTGLNCIDCHVSESLNDLARFADDTPRKNKARQMIRMMNAINQTNYGGARTVTCNTCHNGSSVPEGVPSLARQYAIAEVDPNTVERVADSPGPSATEILDKFVEASGGAQRLATLTSYTAKGTYEGFDTYNMPVPYEVLAKAPSQRTVIVHTQNGDNTFSFDGQTGWIAVVDRASPLMLMTPGEVDSVKIDNDLAFPGNIRQTLSRAQAGFPPAYLNDKKTNVIQAVGANSTRMKLFFDAESGMLLRLVRYTPTMIGTVLTQVDYEDYKDVAGVKMPMKSTITWTDGQAMIELTDVQPNVVIDATRFGKPSPAALKRVR